MLNVATVLFQFYAFWIFTANFRNVNPMSNVCTDEEEVVNHITVPVSNL
jgi:hypothetical protein